MAFLFEGEETSILNSQKILINENKLQELEDNKVNISDISANLNLYFTNLTSEVAGYNKLLTSMSDPEYQSEPAVVENIVVSGADQLLFKAISTAGLIKDQAILLGEKVTMSGEVINTSGTNTGAKFYAKVKRLESDGVTETLLGTSNITEVVYDTTEYTTLQKVVVIVESTPFEFEDKIIVEFYGTKVTADDPTYSFKLGGGSDRPMVAGVGTSISKITPDGVDIVEAIQRDTDSDVVSDAEKVEVTKLVADKPGARANLEVESTAELDARDVVNRARENHTGTQTAATISDFEAAVKSFETPTNLSINANILTFTNEDGVENNIDLSLYLDDSNLARLVTGSLDGQTGIATFTRDDNTSFTVDMSALLDDTQVTVEDNLTSTSAENALSANQGRELKEYVTDAVNAIHTHSNKAVLDAVTASYTVEEETKLAGIEAGATADQTDAEIKAAYENNPDTNVLTDLLLSKLVGIVDGVQKNPFVTAGTLNANGIVDLGVTPVNGSGVGMLVKLATYMPDGEGGGSYNIEVKAYEANVTSGSNIQIVAADWEEIGSVAQGKQVWVSHPIKVAK
jgi:hypothetical protein